jgi:hypothetical protein
MPKKPPGPPEPDLFSVPPRQAPRPPTGRELAEEGMLRAADHADATTENWSDRAFALFVSSRDQLPATS